MSLWTHAHLDAIALCALHCEAAPLKSFCCSVFCCALLEGELRTSCLLGKGAARVLSPDPFLHPFIWDRISLSCQIVLEFLIYPRKVLNLRYSCLGLLNSLYLAQKFLQTNQDTVIMSRDRLIQSGTMRPSSQCWWVVTSPWCGLGMIL